MGDRVHQDVNQNRVNLNIIKSEKGCRLKPFLNHLIFFLLYFLLSGDHWKGKKTINGLTCPCEIYNKELTGLTGPEDYPMVMFTISGFGGMRFWS